MVFTRIFQIQISNKDYLGDSADDGDEDDEDALGHPTPRNALSVRSLVRS